MGNGQPQGMDDHRDASGTLGKKRVCDLKPLEAQKISPHNRCLGGSHECPAAVQGTSPGPKSLKDPETLTKGGSGLLPKKNIGGPKVKVHTTQHVIMSGTQ